LKKKTKKIEDEEVAYRLAIENESIIDVADRCMEFRNADSLSDFQRLFDRVIDSLIVTYDSGGICPTMEGLRDGMHRRRRPISKKEF